MKYAWTIDRDHIDDDSGVRGPRDAAQDLLEELNNGRGRKFRMYDDDGGLYYEGRVVFADRDIVHDLPEEAFGPLYDFGMPNAGCTSIQYRNDAGDWIQL